MQLGAEEFVRLRREMRRSSARSARAIAGAALLVTAVLLLDRVSANQLAGVPLASWAAGLAGLWLLLGAVIGEDD